MENILRILSVKQKIFNSFSSQIQDEKISGILRIELSDGSLFSIRPCYLPSEIPIINYFYNNDLNNFEPREINSEEEAGFRYASECFRAEKTALRLIARAEQCAFGLYGKLKRRGYKPDCINAVLNRLSGLQLVDDLRFAELWLDSHLCLSKSPRQLLSSLCRRGISREDSEAALKTALDEETELNLLIRFLKKYRKKIISLKHLLISEGFSHQVIQRYFTDYD